MKPWIPIAACAVLTGCAHPPAVPAPPLARARFQARQAEAKPAPRDRFEKVTLRTAEGDVIILLPRNP